MTILLLSANMPSELAVTMTKIGGLHLSLSLSLALINFTFGCTSLF